MRHTWGGISPLAILLQRLIFSGNLAGTSTSSTGIATASHNAAACGISLWNVATSHTACRCTAWCRIPCCRICCIAGQRLGEQHINQLLHYARVPIPLSGGCTSLPERCQLPGQLLQKACQILRQALGIAAVQKLKGQLVQLYQLQIACIA